MAVRVKLSSSLSFTHHIYRIQFRRDANKADNKAASVAVDSLINFEAVKVRTFTVIRIESEQIVILVAFQQ
jgi:ABC-type transport system involved in Fe-S cluster assembly fused permease/ATPase subunit